MGKLVGKFDKLLARMTKERVKTQLPKSGNERINITIDLKGMKTL